MMIANNLNKDEIEKIIYSNDKIKQILTGCTVKKIIIIPEKIINIVINK
jgi:leucyl-tRNA synthetase